MWHVKYILFKHLALHKAHFCTLKTVCNHSAHIQRQRDGADLCVRVGDAALASQCVSLTDREQWTGQNRAEVIEGSPPNALGLHRHALSRWRRSSREQLREEGLVAVTIATERSGHAQKTRDSIPAQVHWRDRKWVRRERTQTCVCDEQQSSITFIMVLRRLADLQQRLHHLHHSFQNLDGNSLNECEREERWKDRDAVKIRPVSETRGLSERRQTGASPDRSWSFLPLGESLWGYQIQDQCLRVCIWKPFR